MRIGEYEFNLHKLSDFQFGGNVNGHSLLRKVVALALKDTSALLHMEEQLDREIYREPLRATSSRSTRVGSWGGHSFDSKSRVVSFLLQRHIGYRDGTPAVPHLRWYIDSKVL